METNQALDGISAGLHFLRLDSPDCLPFNPSGEKEELRVAFNDVPRYLFRIFTPRSRGKTNEIWARSMDATDGKPNARRDIFARDEREVEAMLNRHLRWRIGEEDNLVSWTSSLLFALVYIFYLHANTQDGSDFKDISLCVVDTTLFVSGVFLQDLHLISAFRNPDDERVGDLSDFWRLRTQRRQGQFYFGEYLSQGALKIEGKCKIVSAQAMIDQGLYDLQPKFRDFAAWEKEWRPRWANRVVDLRQEFKQEPRDTWEVTIEEQQAAMKIANLFGGQWELPVAANAFALRPRHSWDKRILPLFRAPCFTDEARKDCSAERTKVVAPDTLPEVRQFAELMRQVYQDYPLTQMKDCTSKAAFKLRTALNNALTMNSRGSEANTLAATNPQYAALQQQLNRVVLLAQEIQEQLASL